MKNPKEYTLAEILFICETEARDHLEEAKKLLIFLDWREKQMTFYQVQRDRELVQQAHQISTRITVRHSKSLDADLLDTCVLVEE